LILSAESDARHLVSIFLTVAEDDAARFDGLPPEARDQHGDVRQEQLRRFRERTKTNYKTWKITDEDWRNRGKWEDYIIAAEEMLLKTSTPDSPWTLVEANDKYFSRIKSLRTVAEKLRRALK